jgi:hypothetical protein
VAYFRQRSRIKAIDVLLSFNFAVVFSFKVFPFPPSKTLFLGDVSPGIGNLNNFWFLCNEGRETGKRR